MGKVTIQDIAQELKLSRNTVSKALQGDKSVTLNTRKRIISKASDMGYENITSAALADFGVSAGKSKKIILVKNADLSEFFNRIIIGISGELAKHNCIMSMYIVNDEKSPENKALIDYIRDEADGVICLSLFSMPFMRELVKHKKATVFYDSPVGIEMSVLGVDTVCIDAEKNMYDITKQLIQLGIKTFGFVGNYKSCRSLYDRFTGFRRALDDYSINYRGDLVLNDDFPINYYIKEHLYKRLSELPELPEAFICMTDILALMATDYLNSKGYQIQKDFLIAGFDDSTSAVNARISLTSVKVYNEHIGRRMVQLLIERMHDSEKPFESLTVCTKTIFRESTNYIC